MWDFLPATVFGAFWEPIMGDTRWPCEGPGCERDASSVFRTEFGDVYVCGEHWRSIATCPTRMSWVEELFRCEPQPIVWTALSHEGVGLVVIGSRDSVELTLKDAVKMGQATATFLTDAGLVEVDPAVDWDLEEVRRAER